MALVPGHGGQKIYLEVVDGHSGVQYASTWGAVCVDNIRFFRADGTQIDLTGPKPQRARACPRGGGDRADATCLGPACACDFTHPAEPMRCDDKTACSATACYGYFWQHFPGFNTRT